MDLPHINLKGKTFVKIQCLKCKEATEFETTNKSEEEVNKIIKTHKHTCKGAAS